MISPTITGGTLIASSSLQTPVSSNWVGRVLVIKATATTISVTGAAPNGYQYAGEWIEIT